MKQPKKYVSIKVSETTKKRLDVLSEYLGRSIIKTVDDCVSGMQAKIMLNYIEDQAKVKAKLQAELKETV